MRLMIMSIQFKKIHVRTMQYKSKIIQEVIKYNDDTLRRQFRRVWGPNNA